MFLLKRQLFYLTLYQRKLKAQLGSYDRIAKVENIVGEEDKSW